jgi:hypothetical protein
MRSDREEWERTSVLLQLHRSSTAAATAASCWLGSDSSAINR